MDSVHISLATPEERKRLRANGLTFMECEYCGQKARKGAPLPKLDSRGYWHKWNELYRAERHPWRMSAADYPEDVRQLIIDLGAVVD